MKKVLLCVLTIVVITAKAQFPSPYVVPNIDWIKYHSQMDTVSSAPSSIDANSNVYTTGYSGFMSAANLVVIKYDSTGAQQFVYTYNGGGYDVGRAIKVDAAGNVYIAGITTATTGSTARNYIMIKLNASGVMQWLKTYDRGANNDDEARDIAIDANGHVYVTGRSRNLSGNFDIVTLKLNGTTGNQVWSHIYTGSGLDDEGVAMVLSANGSYLYITGNTMNATNGSNIVTYALNTSPGTAYWSPVVTNGSANGNDKSNAIILYGTDVIVCGERTNSTTGLDYATIRYNGSTGGIIWQASYDFSNTLNRATDLVRDSAGNIGVVGTVLNGSTYEYRTIFYTSNGIQYAVNTENTSLSTLVTDPTIANDTIAHHWYVGGEKQMSTKDIFVYQITPGGNTSWRQNIDGNDSDNDAATAVAVNGVGVVYVGALCRNSSAQFDYTTVKLNQTPVYWPPDFNNEPVNYGHLYFPNKGQIMRTDGVLGGEMLYYTHNTKPTVFIEQKGFDFIFNKVDTLQSTLDTIERIQYEFLGRNTLASFHEYLPRTITHNYYLGYASSPAIENIKGHERIFIPNYYPYIDLHYFSGEGGIKYYLVVKPGASIGEIRMKINGANSTSVDGSSGKLSIDGKLGDVTLERPIAYTVNWLGQVVPITTGSASWNSLGSNMYNILPPTYNAAMPLIIQVSAAQLFSTASPNITETNLEYSTYYGAQDNEVFTDVKALANGNRYVTGYCSAGTFPAFLAQNFYNGNFDAVLLRYTADDTLRYATFQGGTGIDQGLTVATDSQENVFIGGLTTSMDMFGLNVTGATNQFNNGAPSSTAPFKQDGFLCKLAQVPFGGTLVWRRYFGGGHSDAVNSIYIDAGDNLYVAGYSYSTNFPIVNAFKATGCATTVANPANRDTIFGKFASNLSAQWITYHGGSANATSGTETQDSGNDIVVDNGGNVYGCGYTDATDYACVNSTGSTNSFFDNTLGGQSDGFLVRFNSSGTPDFSSYFGGSNSDGLTRLVFKSWPGEVFFAGTSYKGTGFPFYSKAGATNSQYSLGGTNTPFVGYMDVNMNRKWCTYWGNGQTSAKQYQVNGLSVDDDGVVYLSGWTTSDTLTYPSTAPTTIVYTDATRSGEDGFIAIYSPFKTLYHAHYFGGVSSDRINNTDVAQNQKLYLVGVASSNDFPIAYNSLNASLVDSIAKGGQDGFISRFDLENYQVTNIKQVDFERSMLLLYPNPANTQFNLEIEGVLNSKPTVKVYNLMGQLIFQEQVANSRTKINCESWTNGVYLINVSNKETTKTFKLIKQ